MNNYRTYGLINKSHYRLAPSFLSWSVGASIPRLLVSPPHLENEGNLIILALVKSNGCTKVMPLAPDEAELYWRFWLFNQHSGSVRFFYPIWFLTFLQIFGQGDSFLRLMIKVMFCYQFLQESYYWTAWTSELLSELDSRDRASRTRQHEHWQPGQDSGDRLAWTGSQARTIGTGQLRQNSCDRTAGSGRSRLDGQNRLRDRTT